MAANANTNGRANGHANGHAPSTQTDPPPILNRFGGGPMPGGGPGAGMLGKAPRAQDTRATLLHLWDYLRRQRLALIVASILVVITSALNLLGPDLLGVAFDRYIVPRDLAGLAQLAVLMLGVYA